MKILIINNERYHFETALGIYSAFKNIGHDVELYFCDTVKSINRFQQLEFCKKFNIELPNIYNINPSNTIGVVVSTYPSSLTKEKIPNEHDNIFSIIPKNKYIYICHRFHQKSDYEKDINLNNAMCLSPLAEKIGMDYIWLTSFPFQPLNTFKYNNKINLTIQGHFEFNGRSTILNEIDSKLLKHKNLLVNIMGTNARNFTAQHNFLKFPLRILSNLTEEYFYKILNEKTDFIIPSININTKGGTYINQRYSTNFNHAYALEKPIFCHEIFKDIYQVPGIYYNENNINEKFEQMVNITKEEYDNLIQEFKDKKYSLNIRNKTLIQNKVEKILQQGNML